MSSALVPVMSQMNPVYTLNISARYILVKVLLLMLRTLSVVEGTPESNHDELVGDIVCDEY